MNSTIKKYTVSILNETYSLLSDESEFDIEQAALQVDLCIKEIMSKGIDSKKAAILAALKISLDLRRNRHHLTNVERTLVSVEQRLGEILE